MGLGFYVNSYPYSLKNNSGLVYFFSSTRFTLFITTGSLGTS